MIKNDLSEAEDKVNKLNVLLKMFDVSGICSIGVDSVDYKTDLFYVFQYDAPSFRNVGMVGSVSLMIQCGSTREHKEYGTFEELERHVRSMLPHDQGPHL